MNTNIGPPTKSAFTGTGNSKFIALLATGAHARHGPAIGIAADSTFGRPGS